MEEKLSDLLKTTQLIYGSEIARIVKFALVYVLSH